MSVRDDFDDFEPGVGTYLKVIRFPEPTNPDSFVVLYLRPGGRFLMAGYWSGYERSSVAGRWLRRGSDIHLEGAGQEFTDVISAEDGSGRAFSRVLHVAEQHHTPILTATGELAGWSLLGWPGPLTYVGHATVIDPDGRWLPKSLEAVENWIGRLAVT